jgi:FkbM family methyltransferase
MLKQVYRSLRRGAGRLLFQTSPGAYYSLLKELRTIPKVDVCAVLEKGGISTSFDSVELNPQSVYEYSYLQNLLTKERDTSQWILGFGNQGTFFDVGANIGMYSVLCALANPSMKIFSFEPESSNYFRLVKNAAKFEGRIGAACAALGSEVKFIGMESVGEHGDFGGLTQTTKAPSALLAAQLDVDSVARMLDRIPTHVKIDVDGYELEVLRGAEKTFANAEVRSVMIEISSDESEIKDRMQRHGFEILSVNPRNNNILFARPKQDRHS